MNMPAETVRECDNCGRDIVCVRTIRGLEPNDQRDFVYTDNRIPVEEWVFACAGCREAMGVGDERD